MSYDDAWLAQQLQKPGYRLVQGTRPPQLPLRTPLTLHDDAPEGELQGKVQKLCKNLGYLHSHALRSKGSAAGLPDSLIIHPDIPNPILYTWELKRADEEPKPAQRRWLEALARATSIHTAVYQPIDFPAIVDILTGGLR